MTQREAALSGIEISHWEAPLCVVLDNGVTLIPLCDPEGNGPGCLTGVYAQSSIYLTPEP